VLLFFIIILIITVAVLAYKKVFSKAGNNCEINNVSYLPSYETRIKITNSKLLDVEFRGVISDQDKADISFETTAHTVSDYNSNDPVLSLIDMYQKTDSKNFLNLFTIYNIDPHSGSYEWRKVCSIPLNFLQTAYSGKQKVMVKISLINNASSPEDIISHTHHFTTNTIHKGYLEEGQDILDARKIIIQLAVAIAHSDNEYHPNEYKVLEHWIQKTTKPYKSEQKIETDQQLRYAAQNAEDLIKKEVLVVDKLLEELKDTRNRYLFYEALELLIDVMTSDGIEQKSEAQFINKIAKALSVDHEELSRIKSQKIKKLEAPLVSKNG